jgi:hypothetical protein
VFKLKNTVVVFAVIRPNDILSKRIKMMRYDMVDVAGQRHFTAADYLNDFPYPLVKFPTDIYRFSRSRRNI